MRTHRFFRGSLVLLAALYLTSGGALAFAQVAIPTLLGPSTPIKSGGVVSVGLAQLNPGSTPLAVRFPQTLAGLLRQGTNEWLVTLKTETQAQTTSFDIAPGSFARTTYNFQLPTSAKPGSRLELNVVDSPATPIVIEVEVGVAVAAVDPASTPEQPETREPQTGLGRFVREAEPKSLRPDYQPSTFFKEHFFGYEPFYFIAGPEVPNARFQVSLRYQLVNKEGWLAQKAPLVKGVNFAYTQTSLWDLTSPSAPFFDTSYKPELLYLIQKVDGGRWGDGFALDLQGGVQHESNGKGGLDSRSLNIAYFRPTVTLGHEDGFQLSLSPRTWVYVGDLRDNPDLTDYRGYADLRATVGWKRGVQLATTGRIGDDGGRGSLQLDLTYPMMNLLAGSLSLYLHAQYFSGYGESLLQYNQRSDSFRVGFGLYR